MSTQGLLSIVQNERTKWKIVTGCDGYNIPKLAYLFAVDGVPDSIDEVHEFATNGTGLFGSCGCLYVLGESEWRNKENEPPPLLYATSFQMPEFNPRWERGTADYAMIYDLDRDCLRVVRRVKAMDE